MSNPTERSIEDRPARLTECRELKQLRHRIQEQRNEIARLRSVEEKLNVGDYRITRYGRQDYWIEHRSGEGMQVFKINFERLIDDFYTSEF